MCIRDSIDTDSYKNLQEEIKKTEKRLNGLKKEAKAVSEEFGNPVSPEQYNAFQRDIIATEAELKKLSEQLDLSLIHICIRILKRRNWKKEKREHSRLTSGSLAVLIMFRKELANRT